jgi:hypothetical protein
MMVFFMPCYAKQAKTAGVLSFVYLNKYWLILALCLLLCPPLSWAQSTRVATESIGLEGKYVQLLPNSTNDAWDLHANFAVKLPVNVSELAKSAPLYFVLDWSIKRPRWYWYDERLAKGRLYWRLSYNGLTQKWRMSVASSSAISEARFALTFNTLQEALSNLQSIRRDAVVKTTHLQANETYEISTRLYLDTNLLPKPFQLNVMNDTDWVLDSGVMRKMVKVVSPTSNLRIRK